MPRGRRQPIAPSTARPTDKFLYVRHNEYKNFEKKFFKTHGMPPEYYFNITLNDKNIYVLSFRSAWTY